MKRIDYYTSCMHIHVRYYVYEPKVILRIKGVVQIHHGLSEHADRYDHFASYLSNQGFVVVVSDFVGHGKSLIDFEQGYFGNSSGPEHLVQDMAYLQKIIRGQYPDAPYFLLGVDLGSLLIRKFMSVYGDFIDGAILLGTIAKIEHRYLKKAYLYMMRTWKGPLYKAHQYFDKWQQHLNHKTEHGKMEWLTSDVHERKKYLADPMTHFAYTIQGYFDIMQVTREVNNEDSIAKIPNYLSLYIGVGENDPMCKGIDGLIEKYKKRGIKDLTFHSFEKRHHALLFETNKKEIYEDILRWLNERTYL